MAYNRALVGIAGAVLTVGGAAGVNKYQVAQMAHLPAPCLDAIQKQLADGVIQSLFPPGTSDHALVAIILIVGLALAFTLMTSPLGDFVTRLIKGETI